MAVYEEITLLREILDAVGGEQVEVGEYERIQLLQGISDALNTDQAQSRFLGQLLQITGDTRLLWLPGSADTTTATDKSLNGRTITWDATVAARLSRLGLGYAQSFSGSGQYGTVPDAANLSFGNGTNDSAFSVIVLANVTNTAAARLMLTKLASSNNEYSFGIDSSGRLSFQITDQSASAAAESKFTTAAVSQGSWQLFAGTYSAAVGGTSASGDMSLYINGLLVSGVTLADAGTYVAMEDLTANVGIGAHSAGTSPFSGSMALAVICQKNLSASEHWAIYQLLVGYFNFLA